MQLQLPHWAIITENRHVPIRVWDSEAFFSGGTAEQTRDAPWTHWHIEWSIYAFDEVVDLPYSDDWRNCSRPYLQINSLHNIVKIFYRWASIVLLWFSARIDCHNAVSSMAIISAFLCGFLAHFHRRRCGPTGSNVTVRWRRQPGWRQRWRCIETRTNAKLMWFPGGRSGLYVCVCVYVCDDVSTSTKIIAYQHVIDRGLCCTVGPIQYSCFSYYYILIGR